MKENQNVSMISRAMEMLELLAVHPIGLTLQEMVDTMNYPKSSVHKIATNLYSLGYVGKEIDSFRYFLSRKLLSIGLSAVSGHNIIERSREYMNVLRDNVGESVMIGTLLNREVILLNQVEGNFDFVFTLKHGMRFNLYSTAPGKVLLAYMPKEVRSEIVENLELESINEYTITNKQNLVKELERIEKAGYAIDLEETMKGVHCIAAPIFDEENNAIACVWTSGPAGRLPKNKVAKVAKQVVDCGLTISYNIGYKKN